MIDFEAIKETTDGTRFDRLTALLIGTIAVLAACLAVVQMAQSQAEGRANILTSRITVDLSGRLSASADQETFMIGSSQRAIQLEIDGTSRQIVALDTGDAAADGIGKSDVNAGERLLAIAAEMGTPPAESGPIDAYARHLLVAPIEALIAEVTEQNRLVDVANDASNRSSMAVLGLSMVALAGVLVGLAAVVGEGRAGRLTLLMAYLGASAALISLVRAVV